jgi:hypothetical protein
MDKPEGRKVLRERAGTRQQCLEHQIRDGGGHSLCVHPVEGGPPLLGYLGDLVGIRLALLTIMIPILGALLLAGAAKPLRTG